MGQQRTPSIGGQCVEELPEIAIEIVDIRLLLLQNVKVVHTVGYQLQELKLDDLIVVIGCIVIQGGAQVSQRKVVNRDTQLGLLLGIYTPGEQLDEQQGQFIAAFRCPLKILEIRFDGFGYVIG